MSSSKTGNESQVPLTTTDTIESEIKEVKKSIRKIERQIESFENDKSSKVKKSPIKNSQKRFIVLEKRLAGLEGERKLLRTQTLSPPQEGQGK